MRTSEPHGPMQRRFALPGARAAAGALALALALAGCSSGSSKSPATTTSLTPSALSSSVTPSTRSAPATTTSTPSATPHPTSSTSLGGDCTSVLPLLTVNRLVGKTVVGKTAFVINIPDYALGQVERVNCQYGLVTPKGKKTASAPQVEVSVSLYDTNAHAAARVAATKETWLEGGAVPHAVSVHGHAGVVLIGFGTPLLVLGVGARTIAVSMASTLVTAARRDAVMTALAASALSSAGG